MLALFFLFFGISVFAAASRVRPQLIVNDIMDGKLGKQGMRIGRDDPEHRMCRAPQKGVPR